MRLQADHALSAILRGAQCARARMAHGRNALQLLPRPRRDRWQPVSARHFGQVWNDFVMIRQKSTFSASFDMRARILQKLTLPG